MTDRHGPVEADREGFVELRRCTTPPEPLSALGNPVPTRLEIEREEGGWR